MDTIVALDEPAGVVRTVARVPGEPWQAPEASFHVPLQDSTTKLTLDGAVAVPVYAAREIARLPVLRTLKSCGANEGLDVVPAFLNVSSNEPLPEEPSVADVATAPQLPAPTDCEADVTLAVVAAAAAAIDVHTRRAAATTAAPALPGCLQASTRASSLLWWPCAGIP